MTAKRAMFQLSNYTMDLQSFIRSGLLEAYLLGQCSAEEHAQVERMAAQHPEVRAEMAAIEISLESYAAAHAVTPPDWMKARILERIGQEAPNQSPPDAPTPGPSKTPLRTFQIVAFLLAAASSFLFFRQKETNNENDQLRLEKESLQQQLAACNLQAQQPDPLAELLCDPATQRILVSDGKGINTVFYYNSRLKKMAYDPYGLPIPKPGKHYQFWAIVGEQPVSMGMQAANMCESVRTVESPQAFAISEEGDPAGNPTPTLVLAVGKAG